MAEARASEEQIARLRLIRSENIGPVTYFQLLARFGSASAALAAVPDLAARGGGRAPPLPRRGRPRPGYPRPRRGGAREGRRGEARPPLSVPRPGPVPAAARRARDGAA